MRRAKRLRHLLWSCLLCVSWLGSTLGLVIPGSAIRRRPRTMLMAGASGFSLGDLTKGDLKIGEGLRVKAARTKALRDRIDSLRASVRRHQREQSMSVLALQKEELAQRNSSDMAISLRKRVSWLQERKLAEALELTRLESQVESVAGRSVSALDKVRGMGWRVGVISLLLQPPSVPSSRSLPPRCHPSRLLTRVTPAA